MMTLSENTRAATGKALWIAVPAALLTLMLAWAYANAGSDGPKFAELQIADPPANSEAPVDQPEPDLTEATQGGRLVDDLNTLALESLPIELELIQDKAEEQSEGGVTFATVTSWDTPDGWHVGVIQSQMAPESFPIDINDLSPDGRGVHEFWDDGTEAVVINKLDDRVEPLVVIYFIKGLTWTRLLIEGLNHETPLLTVDQMRQWAQNMAAQLPSE